MAIMLEDLPNWIIDPYNEPTKVSAATVEADKQAWFEAVAGVIQGVREVTDNIILVQWTTGEWYGSGVYVWAPEFLSYLEGLGLTDNIVLSTHNYHDNFVHYRWFETPTPNNTLEQLRADYEHNGLAKAAREFNYPILIGEIGADDSLTGEDWEQEKIWFGNALTLYNEFKLSYLGWTWRPRNPTSSQMYCMLVESNFNNLTGTPSESGQILIDKITG